jgi:TetR/AcrR family transcriptional regulator, cholesterol catabolism regulator
MTVNAGTQRNDRRLRKSDVTRGRILDAAAEVFRDKGYPGARLSDIADLADTQAGSLYYHFDSKEQLAEEVLAIGVDRVSAAVSSATTALPPDAAFADRLRAAVEAHVTGMLENDAYSAANVRIISQVPADVRERHLSHHRHYGAFWRDFLRTAQATGELRDDLDLVAMRMLVLGALNWSVEWYRPGRLSPQEIALQFTEIILRGILPQPKPR